MNGITWNRSPSFISHTLPCAAPWMSRSGFQACFHCCPPVMTQAPVTTTTTTSESCVASISDQWWPVLCCTLRVTVGHSILQYDHSWNWFPPNMTRLLNVSARIKCLFCIISGFSAFIKRPFLQGSAGTWLNKCLFFPTYSENYWALLVSFSFPYKGSPISSNIEKFLNQN